RPAVHAAAGAPSGAPTRTTPPVPPPVPHVLAVREAPAHPPAVGANARRGLVAHRCVRSMRSSRCARAPIDAPSQAIAALAAPTSAADDGGQHVRQSTAPALGFHDRHAARERIAATRTPLLGHWCCRCALAMALGRRRTSPLRISRIASNSAPLEEGIAEHAIHLGRTQEVGNAPIENGGGDKPVSATPLRTS